MSYLPHIAMNAHGALILKMWRIDHEIPVITASNNASGKTDFFFNKFSNKV